MTQFTSPAGRMVQGSVIMTHQKDMQTQKPLYNDDGTPTMGIFFAIAIPKVVPGFNGNPEWDQFWALLKTECVTAWPSLFPQGVGGNSTHPRFSYKYQDGDGTDDQGKSVANKPGFAGHHIIKFTSQYAVRCFMKDRYSPHEELAKPDDTIKKGDWIKVIGDVRGNNATGTQVPGISIYPNVVIFMGQDPAGRINSGPDVAAVMGAQGNGGYVPAGVSVNPAVVSAAAAVAVPAVSVPGAGAVAVPAVAVPNVAVPAVSVPGAVAMPVAGAVAMPVAGAAVVMPTPEPKYDVNPNLKAGGITVDGLLTQGGWTLEAAIAQGHIVRVA